MQPFSDQEITELKGRINVEQYNTIDNRLYSGQTLNSNFNAMCGFNHCNDQLMQYVTPDAKYYKFTIIKNKCGLTAEQISNNFITLMTNIQKSNNIPEEELGRFCFLHDNYGMLVFVYEIGSFFNKHFTHNNYINTRGIMYAPLKLFRLAMNCEFDITENDNLGDVMMSGLISSVDDTYYGRYQEQCVWAFENLDQFRKTYRFLSSAQTIYNKYQADEEARIAEEQRLAKEQKEKEEQQMKEQAKLQKILEQVTRKTEGRVCVKSRHPSHNPLRNLRSTCRMFIRLGSTTENPKPNQYVELNSVQAVKNSASKILMKRLFTEHNIPTPLYCIPKNEAELTAWYQNLAQQYKTIKLVVKSEFGSRGEGNSIHNSLESAVNYLNQSNRWGRYVVEKYYGYNKEYRLHVSARGECFYTCRKMLKNGTPEDQKWVRNDSTCVWIMEDNEQFAKPSTWEQIVTAAVGAITAVGLDFGAVDVRVSEKGEFVILETNSAPSFGEVTLEKYCEELPALAWYKIQQLAKQ